MGGGENIGGGADRGRRYVGTRGEVLPRSGGRKEEEKKEEERDEEDGARRQAV